MVETVYHLRTRDKRDTTVPIFGAIGNVYLRGTATWADAMAPSDAYVVRGLTTLCRGLGFEGFFLAARPRTRSKKFGSSHHRAIPRAHSTMRTKNQPATKATDELNGFTHHRKESHATSFATSSAHTQHQPLTLTFSSSEGCLTDAKWIVRIA